MLPLIQTITLFIRNHIKKQCSKIHIIYVIVNSIRVIKVHKHNQAFICLVRGQGGITTSEIKRGRLERKIQHVRVY